MALYDPPNLNQILPPSDLANAASEYNALGVDSANVIISSGAESSSQKTLISRSRRCSMIGCSSTQSSDVVQMYNCYNLHVIGNWGIPHIWYLYQVQQSDASSWNFQYYNYIDSRLRSNDNRVYVFCEFLRCSGDIKAYNLSDIRLKDDVSIMKNCLNDLLKIKCINFNWKNRNGERDIGLIAQEVEKIKPQIVRTRHDGTKALSYKKMTAIIVGAIQDQNKKIKRIKEKIERVKNGR